MRPRANVGRFRAQVRAVTGTHRLDYGIVATVAALLVIGLVMVYSTTYMLDYENPNYFIARQFVWLVLGLLALLAFLLPDYHHWQRVSILIMALVLIIAGAMAYAGEERFGAQRWLFGGSVQPSELVKLGLIIYVADWLASKGQQIRQITYGLLPFSVMVGLICGLVLLQQHLSTPVIMAIVAFSMFFTAGADLGQMVISALAGGTSIAVLILQADYRLERIKSFWNPLFDPSDKGFHATQALRALKAGGLFGVGLARSEIKFQGPFVWHSDTIFAIIGEELGLLGCLVVLGLFWFLAYQGLSVARRAADPFGRFLAVGITTWITVQAMIHIGAAVAALPPTGVPLPFISYGGSALVSCLAGVGLLLNVSRHARPAEGELGGAFSGQVRR